MTEKTIGQVAYEAYCETTDWKSLVSGASLPKWESVMPTIKEAWEKAAAAAVDHFILPRPEDDEVRND